MIGEDDDLSFSCRVAMSLYGRKTPSGCRSRSPNRAVKWPMVCLEKAPVCPEDRCLGRKASDEEAMKIQQTHEANLSQIIGASRRAQRITKSRHGREVCQLLRQEQRGAS